MQFTDRILDADVHYGTVGPLPAEVVQISDEAWATPDSVFTDIQGIKLEIRGSSHVTVEVSESADPTMVGPMLYGFATRVLMLHEGTFNLHASLVRFGDEHIAIGGRSGAGKSTTVVSLANAFGGTVLIDDVLPVDLVDGRPVARTFARPVHLTRDALTRTGTPPVGDPIGDQEFGKLAIDLARPSEPVVIDRLVVLNRFDPSDPDDNRTERGDLIIGPERQPTTDVPLVTTAISGAERLQWLVRLANNGGLSSMGARGPAFFAWSTGVAAALPTLLINRLDGADTLGAVHQAILGGAPD